MPANGVAHGVPDALREVRRTAWRHRARAGRQRGGHRRHRPGARWRVSRVGDQPRRERARALDLAPTRHSSRGRGCPSAADVLETVGAATWSHSSKHCDRVAESSLPARQWTGSAGGAQPALLPAAVRRRVHDGTRSELAALAQPCVTRGVRPIIDRVLPLADAREGFAALERGDVFGKVVFTT